MYRSFAVFALTFATIATTSYACPPLELLVPAYQYPTVGTMWQSLAAPPSPGVRVTIILNPNSGPGAAVDPNYSAALQAVRASAGPNVRIVAYIATSYASKPPAAVLAEAQQYLTFYGQHGINGVFLDEMDNQPPPAASFAYYQNLTTSIHALIPGGIVIGNPGTAVPHEHFLLNAADMIVNFENDFADPNDPFGNAIAPTWQYSVDRSRIANIVFGVSDESAMRSVIQTLHTRNVGVVYVSPDALPNPYDTLPTYWPAELQAARPCPADFDCSLDLEVQDIFTFLNAWFIGVSSADFNAVGGVTVQDIFDFLNAWFAGC